jgi:hypothetical protein
MSVLCSFTQVPPHLLQKIQKSLPVLELFRIGEPMDSESEKIGSIQGLSSSYNQLLCEVLVEPEQAIGQLTLWDLQKAVSWKHEYPKEYELLRSEFYQILIEGKTTSDLDLGKSWDAIGYIFRGDVYSGSQPFLVDQTSEEARVEVVFGGRRIDEGIRYLESTEVREIADVLSSFSTELIRKRFEQGQLVRPKLYRYNWSEEAYEFYLRYCHEVKNFYADAANLGKGILVDFG